MTNARNADHASVIHIRAGAPGESEQMDALLKSMPCHVITWTDVYCGLARLGRLARDPAQCADVRAVIVEVDTLAAPEMPFFTFTARLFPRTPILVYRAHAGATRVSEACNLGAAGWADKDAIAGLFEPADSAGDTVHAPDRGLDSTVEQARSPLDQRIDPLPTTPIAPPRSEAPCAEAQPDHSDDIAAKDDETVGDENVGDDREVTPTRVPWLRYEDVPTRRGPTRVKPPVAESTPSDDRDKLTEAQQESRDDSGPLLTDEELQALIGDDISAVAPREPAPRPPSDRSDQGGDS